MKEHARGSTVLLRTLLLATLLISSNPLLSQATTAQTTSSIGTEGAVWTAPRISIVITPSTGAQWYKQSYASDATHAVQRWSQSVIVFTDNHGYNYLRQLAFDVYINTTILTNTNIPTSPDVKISFVQNFPSTGTPALGVTQSRTTVDNHFEPPVTMRLAAQDPDRLRQLTDNDMVNIATHEFGHALGLGHANTPTTDDNFFELMSTSYNLPVGSATNPLEAPSTLDLYALATIYSWLATNPTLTGPGPAATTITLPANIAYTCRSPQNKPRPGQPANHRTRRHNHHPPRPHHNPGRPTPQTKNPKPSPPTAHPHRTNTRHRLDRPNNPKHSSSPVISRQEE